MLHGDGVGEFDVEARHGQAINQPVPVVGGFDDDAGEFVPMRGKQRQDAVKGSDLYVIVSSIALTLHS